MAIFDKEDPLAEYRKYHSVEHQQAKKANAEARKSNNEKRYAKTLDSRSNNAARLNKQANVVMSALTNAANNRLFSADDVKTAAEEQRSKKLRKWHDYKIGIESALTTAELLAAGYGVGRGLLHLGEYGANKTGRTALANTLGNYINKVDKPQVIMNGLGTAADIGQLVTSDNTFDAVENSLEAGAGTAGIVGGTNWFRGRPFFGRYGNTIDNILDAAGYGAASWDIVKQLPPLSNTLNNIKDISKKRSLETGGK